VITLQIINCVNCGTQLGQVNQSGEVFNRQPGDNDPYAKVDEAMKVHRKSKRKPTFTMRGGQKKTMTCPNCGTKNGIY